MSWFAAHIVMVVRFKDNASNLIPAWENIHLIESENPAGAQAKAEEIGRSLEGDSDGSFFWNDQPARWEFGGIRKILDIARTSQEGEPIDGTEVTYSSIEFESERNLAAFLNGDSVRINVVE